MCSSMDATNCNHNMAKCVETTEPKGEGDFVEHYECACGATGTIRGREEQPPQTWTKTGRVFR